MLSSILYLSGMDSKGFNALPPIIEKGQGCGTVLTGFEYDEAMIPAPLRQPVRDAVKQYLDGTAALSGYDSVACFDGKDEAWGISASRDIDGSAWIRVITPGTENKAIQKTFKEECGGGWL